MVYFSDRDAWIITALEEIKGTLRQNTLMLQALLKRQGSDHIEATSMEEFQFPMETMEHSKRIQELLDETPNRKKLVCILNFNPWHTGHISTPESVVFESSAKF